MSIAADLRRKQMLDIADQLRAMGLNTLATEISVGTLSTLEPGEPLFILRGRDMIAPPTIRYWITTAEQSISYDHKVEAARARLEAFERWGGSRRMPD